MLSRSTRIKPTTAADRAARRQRAEDKRAVLANIGAVLRGAEPTITATQAVDEPRKAWCREQRCAIARVLGRAAGRCWGPVDPNHNRHGVGMGVTDTDDQIWPICRGHHRQWHDRTGYADMSLDEQRDFEAARIAEAQADYAAYRASLAPQPGDPVSLGGREGAVLEVLVDRMRVRWLDGSITEEKLP